MPEFLLEALGELIFEVVCDGGSSCIKELLQWNKEVI